VDLRRLRAGEWLAAAGAVALVVSLFVDRDDGPVVDVLLAALAGLALLLGGLQATQTSPAKPVGAGVLTVAFGLIGVVLVLFNGGVLALVSTVAITAGGWLSIAKERVRGLPPGPEPELRPSPRIADRAQP
jgi:subtilisin family serine protease